MKLSSRGKHGGTRHRIAGIKKWPSKAKHGTFKHRILRIKRIRYRTPKRKHPDDAIPIADTDIVVAPASPTSAQTDMNSLPPEMLFAIFENLDSVQHQAIMRTCRSWMELLRDKFSRCIKLDLFHHRQKNWSLECVLDDLLQDRIQHHVVKPGEPDDRSVSYVDTIHLKGFDTYFKHRFRTEVRRWTLNPRDIEECVGSRGEVVFRTPVKLILEDMELDWSWSDDYPDIFAKCRQIVLKNFWLIGLCLDPKFSSSVANVSFSMDCFDRRIDFLQIECNPEHVNVVAKQLLKRLGEVETEKLETNEAHSYNSRLEDLSYYLNPSGRDHQTGQELEKELQRLGLIETTLDWKNNFGSQSMFVRHLLRMSLEASPHDDEESEEESDSFDDDDEEEQ